VFHGEKWKGKKGKKRVYCHENRIFATATTTNPQPTLSFSRIMTPNTLINLLRNGSETMATLL
jgi:hypothetical protein